MSFRETFPLRLPRAFEVYPRKFNEAHLRNLFYRKIFSSRTIGVDKVTPSKFLDDIDLHISCICRKVSRCDYRFSSYRLLLISKGRKKSPREISIPTVRDRVVLAALSELLCEVYGDECETPHPQSVVTEVRDAWRSGRFTHCLKADLEKFYSSIEHGKLMRLLGKRIRKEEIVCLLKTAITTPTVPLGTRAMSKNDCGIPEGLSISNRLANIFASQLDKIYSKYDKIIYFRYVDDVLIFFNCFDCSPSLMEKEFAQHVESVGLSLNCEKTATKELAVESVDYLGYILRPDGIMSVRSSSVRRLEQSLDSELRHMRGKGEADRGSALARLNLRITGCRVTEDGNSYHRYGWLHYYSRIDDVALLCRLDALVANLSARYNLGIEGKVKSFKKSYYEMRYKSERTNYIPSFNCTLPPSLKRKDLSMLFPREDWAAKSDEEVDLIYSREIRKLVSRLEKDVGMVS